MIFILRKGNSDREKFNKINILVKSIMILIILAIFNHFVPMSFIMNLMIFIGADLLAIFINN